jgi:predicted small secreted protein
MCAASSDIEARSKAMSKLWVIVMVSLGAAWLLAACNTVQGIGKDISKAGETIENASKKK